MDIVIRGGTVIDGTGRPGFTADVGIRDGVIAEIGRIAARGREEIDAAGQIVTPGFVDIHTHYDGQAMWDSHLAPSSWHGVTTAIMGNCGVGFAPCKAEDRGRLIELMEGVEDIPAPALYEGLDWKWQSFADYLDRLAARPRDIDIGALLPHAPLRVYVMGERATDRENATAEDNAAMRKLAEAAVRAGAFGFSTSRTIRHKTLAGDYMPTLRAEEAELTEIALGLRDAGGGMIGFVSDWTPDPRVEFGMVRRIVSRTELPLVFTLSQQHSDPKNSEVLLALSDQAAAGGLPIRPVFAPRAIGVLLGLSGTQNPFSGCPTYKPLAKLPAAEQARRMADPAIRAKILSEDPKRESTFALIHQLGYSRMFPFDQAVDYEPPRERSIEAMAARQGRTPEEVAYDFLIADEGRNFLLMTLVNYASYDLSFVEKLLAHKNTMVGLGDGGAHVGFVCDGSFPTFLLAHWGRDRATGRQSVEELVRRHTSDIAHSAGLDDRGVIAPGRKADVNVIDFDRLKLDRPYIVHDLPAGGRRFLQKAEGYTATIKSGAVSYRDGESTGVLNGTLLRGGPKLPLRQ